MIKFRYYILCGILTCLLNEAPFALMAQPQHLALVSQDFLSDTTVTKACHASTLVITGENTLLAAWFGGSYEGSPDVKIWLSRNEGNGWQKPVPVADGVQADGRQYACWNPVLFRATDGILHLHYKVGPNPREWRALYKTSTDNGASWSDAHTLPEGFLGPIKNKPLQADDHTILYPSSVESRDEKSWTVHTEESGNNLRHWRKTRIDNDSFQAIQPAFLVHKNGKLQLLARSRENVIVQSWSGNKGRTWSPLTRTGLPNPNSGIDAVSVNDTVHVLVYNPLASGKDWWEGRSVLKVAVSKDGINWTDRYTLENEIKGEYSYPAVIADRSGNIYITYTYDRKRIRFVHLKTDHF